MRTDCTSSTTTSCIYIYIIQLASRVDRVGVELLLSVCGLEGLPPGAVSWLNPLAACVSSLDLPSRAACLCLLSVRFPLPAVCGLWCIIIVEYFVCAAFKAQRLTHLSSCGKIKYRECYTTTVVLVSLSCMNPWTHFATILLALHTHWWGCVLGLGSLFSRNRLFWARYIIIYSSSQLKSLRKNRWDPCAVACVSWA